jgi:hypothetical protein
MGTLFYLLGIGLAGFAGVTELEIHFIFISAAILVVGYFFKRGSQLHNIASNEGALIIPKIIVTNLIIYSVLTGVIYFIGSLFS